MTSVPPHRRSADEAELSHSQRQIWVGQRLDPESPLYNMAFAFVFPAELRTDLFAAAWGRVAGASDALRTLVIERDGAPQRLISDTAPSLEVLDFSTREDPLGDFGDWCRQRSTRPLDLRREVVDSVLVRLGDERTGWYLNQHHLIADAWSTQLLYRQVGRLYAALLDGDGEETPELAPYYSTVASLESGERGRKGARAHWSLRRQQPHRVPSFYGRDATARGTASTRLTLEIDEGRSRALEALAGRAGFASVSAEISNFALFATLLVAWLRRIGDSTDLGFDAPVAGRPTPEAKRAVGLFIEMFPFEAKVEPGDTFRTLGARCLKEAMVFLRHALPAMSAPSGATASNIVLNYFPAAFGSFAGHPADVEWVHPGHGDSVHSLRLQVHDFGGTGRTILHFDFNNESLPDRLHRRAIEHFEKMLDACLDNPDAKIGAVDILTREERAALAELNSTGDRPLPEQSIIGKVVEQVRATPERVALREGAFEVSFEELGRQTESVAAALVRSGARKGDRVAILSARSIDTVIGILGILRAGAAYVPIDPMFPRARQEEILGDCGARLLIAPRELSAGSGVLDVAGISVLSIDGARRADDGQSFDGPLPALEDLCYILYTSGSTGRPKGVAIPHAGVADYLGWAARRYVRGERLRFPLFTSLSFDLTVTSLFLPLMTGGELEVYPQTGRVDSALADVLAANVVDIIKLTPSHLSLLRQLAPSDSRLRRIIVGGEDFKTQLAAEVASVLGPEIEIHNEYGPTEAVVGCVAHRYDPALDTGASVPIGAPADHVEVEILNRELSPVPEGVAGELWISRFGLALGYQGLEALTAERFQDHPDRPGQRRYRTGDRVRWVGPAQLEYLGRLDRQVKISGFRVELGEIEAALAALPTIEQAAVVAQDRASVAIEGAVAFCIRCGLPSNHPRAALDAQGVCRVCHSYESIRDQAQGYFKTMPELAALFEESARRHDAPYDCIMLYSGGKDSTYALCRLVEMGLSVYAFTLDNGFISDSAKENIRKVTDKLGVPVEFATTPAMNAIFRDSLNRFDNVCQGCYKTIYTLSTQRARELGVPIIVTGLSRGQMFETRLTEEMFRDGRFGSEEVDAAVLAARKVYHRVDDEVFRSLDVEIFQSDRIFEEIWFVDFYRFCDVGLSELLAYLHREVPWVRPQDTGRSTNCLINDVGIYVHQRQRGYHNYALPYSWDVRMGHKTRHEALAELDDEIDPGYVHTTLAEIGVDALEMASSATRPVLAAFYVSERDLSPAEVREGLRERLPAALIPTHLQRVDEIPLTVQGKIDLTALPRIEPGRPSGKPFRSPEGPVEEFLEGVWRQQLDVERIGGDDNFFDLGGTSLGAMEVMIALCREFDIDLALDTLFARQTLSELARAAEDRILEDVSGITDTTRESALADGENL